VDAGGRVGCAWATCDEADARPAGDFTDSLGCYRGGALVPANGELDRAVVESVKRGEIALARHAEDVAYALDDKLIDQDFSARSRAGIRMHRGTPNSLPRPHRSTSASEVVRR
jgi:hypothetical protein